jgi:uncharacterized membrane protein YfcA
LAIFVGFIVAMTIALTGVGGGTLTVPILILFLGVPTAQAVGTALIFSALVKLPASLVYWRIVNLRVLALLLLGGVPGVIIGSIVLGRLAGAGLENLVLTAVGLTVAMMAAMNLVRLLRAGRGPENVKDRSQWLAFLAFPIGVEVGFSSAGAGALGTLVLFHFTSLGAAAVVATDLLFGLVLSAIGGGLHLSMGAWDPPLLVRLILGGVPGAIFGARIATRVPQRALRIALLLWLTCLGAQLAYRGLQVLAR